MPPLLVLGGIIRGPRGWKKQDRRENESQAVPQPASHLVGTGLLFRNPIPPPANGGEPAQATATQCRFALRLLGPFNALVRTGLSPHPGSLGLRASAYFFPFTVIGNMQLTYFILYYPAFVKFFWCPLSACSHAERIKSTGGGLLVHISNAIEPCRTSIPNPLMAAAPVARA